MHTFMNSFGTGLGGEGFLIYPLWTNCPKWSGWSPSLKGIHEHGWKIRMEIRKLAYWTTGWGLWSTHCEGLLAGQYQRTHDPIPPHTNPHPTPTITPPPPPNPFYHLYYFVGMKSTWESYEPNGLSVKSFGHGKRQKTHQIISLIFWTSTSCPIPLFVTRNLGCAGGNDRDSSFQQTNGAMASHLVTNPMPCVGLKLRIRIN